ncbi:MAG: hypothetical protein L6Q99_14670 [Planctomycetes bacterium]|nr:hypothetical protein [Planctomycetota bacterium]
MATAESHEPHAPAADARSRVGAPAGGTRRRCAARLAVASLGALAAWLVLLVWPLDPRDPTDEHEWTAISIAHFGQVFADRTPPGAAPDEPEWRAGVQATTFGATNPCFAKLVLGAVLWSSGFRDVEPEVFQRFARTAPDGGRAARTRLEPAIERARAVVRIAAALCAGLVALVAFEFASGFAGAPGFGAGFVSVFAAVVAWSAFALLPLFRAWGGFVRTDFFMLACALGVVAAALACRDTLGGERGLAKRWLAASALGGLAGCAVASKFNGAPAALVVAAAVVAAHCAARERRGLGELLGSLALAAVACVFVVWLLDPVLWRDPLGELRAILAFWDEHMRYQQGRAAAQGLATADGPLASLRFALVRLFTRDEPIAALTGHAWGWPLALAGLVVLARAAWRRSFAAQVALAHVVLFGGVTAAWIPLDWDRYFLPLVALVAWLEAAALAELVRFALRRRPTDLAAGHRADAAAG